MTPRPCRACGRELVFVKGPNGNTLPLEKIKPAYSVNFGPAGWFAVIVEPSDGSDLYISHFQSCPSADQFSKRKQQTPAGNKSDGVTPSPKDEA